MKTKRDFPRVVVNKKAVKPVTASLTGSDYDGSEALEYLNQLELKATFPVDNITIFERKDKHWVAGQQIEL